jgi:hypothetical protein
VEINLVFMLYGSFNRRERAPQKLANPLHLLLNAFWEEMGASGDCPRSAGL